MTESAERVHLGGKAIDHLISRIIWKGLVVLIFLAVFVAVQMLRLGVDERYLLLLAGAVCSAGILFVYPHQVVHQHGKKTRSVADSIIRAASMIPYVFGGYLVIFEGLWRLRLLFEQFLIVVLVIALVYIVGGCLVLIAMFKARDFGRAVDSGLIKLD